MPPSAQVSAPIASSLQTAGVRSSLRPSKAVGAERKRRLASRGGLSERIQRIGECRKELAGTVPQPIHALAFLRCGDRFSSGYAHLGRVASPA